MEMTDFSLDECSLKSPVDLNSIDDCTFVAPKGEFKAHTDTVNNTVKPKLFDEQLLECAKNNFEKGRQFERDKILEEFIKRILKNKSLDSRSQQIAIVHLREITGLIYREQLNSVTEKR